MAGEYDLALRQSRLALKGARRIGHQLGIAYFSDRAGDAHRGLGEHDHAAAMWAVAEEMFRTQGADQLATQARCKREDILRTGRPDPTQP